MVGYIQIKGKPDRHKQSRKEIQQGGSIQKTRRCAVFCMRKPIKSIGFPDPIGEISSEISPQVLPRKRFRKEVETMRTRTENDVRKFNEALDRCRRPVFLVSADGAQYNMKSANDYYTGMGRWIHDSHDEMEIFTSCFEDAGVMMDFCMKMSA